MRGVAGERGGDRGYRSAGVVLRRATRRQWHLRYAGSAGTSSHALRLFLARMGFLLRRRQPLKLLRWGVPSSAESLDADEGGVDRAKRQRPQ